MCVCRFVGRVVGGTAEQDEWNNSAILSTHDRHGIR